MRVKLIHTWFSPSEVEKIDKIRTRSGVRFRPGVHDMPDGLFPFLPPTALVLEPPKDKEIEAKPFQFGDNDYHDERREMDHERAVADEEAMLLEEAEALRKSAQRKVILSKARAVKKAKAEARQEVLDAIPSAE